MSKIGGTYEIWEEIITQAYPYRVAQKTSKERSITKDSFRTLLEVPEEDSPLFLKSDHEWVFPM